MKNLLAALALASTAVVPASARTDHGLRYLEKAARRAVYGVEKRVSGKVCVLDFTELAAPDATSEFGQKMAELVASRLVVRAKRRYKVVDRRELIKIARDSVLVAGDDEEVFHRIQKEAGADVFVTGTYSVAGAEVSIDVRAVDAKTLAVLAAATVRVWRTPGLDLMLARRIVVGKGDAAGDAPGNGGASPAKADVAPVELEVGVFYEGGDGKLYPLRDGMVLNSKDNYALYLKPARPSYIYAFQVDSSQKAFPLFPNAEYAKIPNPVSGEIWIPEGGEFLYLDENPGREEIYIFATQAPSPALESLKTARLSDIEATIKTMGVGGRRGSQVLSKVKGTSGNPLELVMRKLAAQGDYYWKTSFIHR